MFICEEFQELIGTVQPLYGIENVQPQFAKNGKRPAPFKADIGLGLQVFRIYDEPRTGNWGIKLVGSSTYDEGDIDGYVRVTEALGAGRRQLIEIEDVFVQHCWLRTGRDARQFHFERNAELNELLKWREEDKRISLTDYEQTVASVKGRQGEIGLRPRSEQWLARGRVHVKKEARREEQAYYANMQGYGEF